VIREVRHEGQPKKPVWIDLSEPTPEELASLTTDYGLHPTLVADCMDPGHLPKHEMWDDATFIMVRVFDHDARETDTTVRSMTNKIALFIGNRFLITVHRKEQPFLEPICEKYRNAPGPIYLQAILLEILLAAVETFHRPLESAETEVHALEAALTTKSHAPIDWGAVFQTQARLTIIKRMLWHTLDAVQKFVPHSKANLPLFQDVRERIQNLQFFAEHLHDDLRNLLALQLALSAQSTNRVMRTLTLYSVFFLPLTFVVGIYGMNFEHMPELEWRYGYLAVWIVLVAIVVGLWLGFRRGGWL
jgi:magnesium transporter